MSKEKLSSRNAYMLIMLIASASSMLLGIPPEADQDTWIALLASLLWTLPAVMIYARLIRLMPGRDIYNMAEAATGKIIGKIISVLFALYCLFVSSLVLNSYAGFAHMTSLFNTPIAVVTLILTSAGLYLAKIGVESLGKWSAIAFFILFISTLFMVVLSIKAFNITNLLPVMFHSLTEIGGVSFKLASFPIGDIVIILALAHGFSKETNSYKLFLLATVSATVFLTAVFTHTCGLLGTEGITAFYFPNYKAAGLVRIGSFLERIEALMGIVYILAGTAKMAAGFIGAGRGVSKVFNLSSYKSIIIPIGLTAAAWAAVMFRNIVELFDFMRIYPYYAPVFQFLIPLIIWIPAEIKAKRRTLPAI